MNSTEKRRMFMSRRKEVPRESETMLTWAAMDQIRQLHEQDPERWTPERISQSFPVSEEGARRFLRSRRPEKVTADDIRKHDELVNKRWREMSGEQESYHRHHNRHRTNVSVGGLVSDNTKLMFETGLTKRIPLKAIHDEPDSSSLPSIPLKENEDLKDDGPFMHIYKKHMLWKEHNKLKPSAGNDVEESQENAEEFFKSRLFTDYLNPHSNKSVKSQEADAIANEDDKIVKMFSQFKQDMKAKLKSSSNRFDQKYARENLRPKKSSGRYESH